MTSNSSSSGSSTAEVKQLKAYNEDLSVCIFAPLRLVALLTSSRLLPLLAPLLALSLYLSQKMLKCSTCMVRFKGVIINRCGHLFCKDCIDARLSNRQRKCPSCGMAFGRDDVSNVYF
jgi:hypothetical protein